MYVEDIKDGVCSFYITLHTELLILLLMSKVLKVSNTMNNWSKAFYIALHTELLILLLMSKVLKVSNTMNN